MVDAYTTKFSRLGRFAPTLVAGERDRERRFQQGLSLKIQEHMVMTVMRTFAEVLEAAQHQEHISGRRKAELWMQKCLTEHTSGASSSRVPQVKRHMTPSMIRLATICEYCQLSGTLRVLAGDLLGYTLDMALQIIRWVMFGNENF